VQSSLSSGVFLRSIRVGISHPGMCTVVRSVEKISNEAQHCSDPGDIPYGSHLSDINVTEVDPSAHHSWNKPGVRIVTTLRNIAVTIGELPRVLLWLSDRLIVLTCKPECSAHERHTNCHTFRTQNRKGETYPHLSPVLSPEGCHCAPQSVVR